MNAMELASARRLSQKLAAKREAQKENRPLSEKIDDSGHVKVWDLRTKKWIVLWPVDAKEAIARGFAALSNPDELGDDDAQSKAKPPTPPNPPSKDIEQMSLPDMRGLATSLGIKDVGGKPVNQAKKDDLLKAIQAVTGQAPSTE